MIDLYFTAWSSSINSDALHFLSVDINDCHGQCQHGGTCKVTLIYDVLFNLVMASYEFYSLELQVG